MMELVRWGIIGCGNVTEVKSGPGFRKSKGSSLVAVMRRDGEKAADYAKRHGVGKWYDDAEKLIADPEVDAVYVATPPGTHEFYAMKVLAAGKPCYVEKPMSRNGAEGERMVKGFREKGVPLFVAYYRRALPRFLKAKELIDGGALGTIVGAKWMYGDMKAAVKDASEPWRVKVEESGGGLFLDMGSHAMDMLDFWFGPLKVVAGGATNQAKAYAVEDSVHIGMVTAEGLRVEVDCSFCREPVDEFQVFGTLGELRISCFGNEAVRVVKKDGTAESFDLPNPEHVGMPLIQTVVDELLGKGMCVITGESGLRTQKAMDVALAEFYGGREDGFWKRWGGDGK